MSKVLLVIPPMTQLNTPYPATAYLKGFLDSRGHACTQADFALELALKIFSRDGIAALASALQSRGGVTALSLRQVFFLEAIEDYRRTVEPVVRFLQGQEPTLAFRLAARTYVPEGPRFTPLQDQAYPLAAAFGTLGVQDRAKHIASLYLDDIADVVQETLDSDFALSRYGEKLASSQIRFDPLLERLQRTTVLDEWLEEITDSWIERVQPEWVGVTAPFPGNVYGAFRIAARIKKNHPFVKTVLGGGYVNTELRWLNDERVHAYFDFLTLDDGEAPLLELLGDTGRRLRTYERGQWRTDPGTHDIPFKETATPSYVGLPLDRYLSMLEMLNPMHRLWSDLRWNKLTLAHGCYWKKCSFCDTSLDYIQRYEPASVDLTLRRMREIRAQTGQSGFHFVDEAAPPAALKALSEKIIAENETFTWWGNIRFEKAFSPEVARSMADAGCVALTGGLEVASDRLLERMQKGVSIEQVARVTKAFSDAGILVHAYLMYGFPTQTVQETVDSLEVVRQLFKEGCIQSAFWHRFSATVHSPVGRDPAAFGVRVHSPFEDLPKRAFAINDVPFTDPTGADHDALGAGLRKALYNYMVGYGLDEDVRAWFDCAVPKATTARTRIRRALAHTN